MNTKRFTINPFNPHNSQFIHSAWLVWVLAICLFLSGCMADFSPAYTTSPPVAIMAGEVISAQAGTVAQLVKDTAIGLSSTKAFISADGQYLLLARAYPALQQWLFWGVKLTNLTQPIAADTIITGGQFTGNGDFSNLAAALERSGWQRVGADKIPPALLAAAQNISSFVAMYAGTMPTFIICPAWLHEDGTFEWWYDPLEIFNAEPIQG